MSNQHSNFLDIEALIAPIEESENGVGEDLTFDPRIDAITNAKQADDPLLAQGDWVTELKVADWDFVKRECADLLTNTSKDLKVALWYVDALSHTDHFAGVIHGLKLLYALNDTYWHSMYPPLEEEDSMDVRVGLLSWFVKVLTEDIKQLPLSDSSHGSYTYNDFLTARAHEKQRHSESNYDNEQTLLLTDYNQAIRISHDDWQYKLSLSVVEVIELWNQLTDQLNDLMGMDAPVFSPVTDLLTELSQHLEPLLPERKPEDNSNKSDDDSDAFLSDTDASVAQFSPSVGFNPTSRDHQANRRQALKLLGQIQDYFAQNEPHSPVTFLLKRSIDWADMPLDQWLKHVIKNEDQLTSLSDMIGITTKQDHDDNSDSY